MVRRISGTERGCGTAIRRQSELAVAAIFWYELAWLARNERITVPIPLRSWLEEIAADVTTLTITPAIAETAASLPSSFPRDPIDRIIYATALEHGCRLVTKDGPVREFPSAHPVALW